MIRNSIAALVLMTLMIVAPLSAEMSYGDQEGSADRRTAARDTYESGTDALDEGEWRVAAEHFRQVANLGVDHADAALYWLAYAQSKMGQRSEALATLVDLQKRYPKSKWVTDGKALEVEVRQSAGQSVAPERVEDEDLKLMAVSGLMNTDPERAYPILEKIVLSKTYSPKVKEKAIFVLAQSNTKKSMDLLARVAKDGSDPAMQKRALRNLGILGDAQSRKLLQEVYTSSNDPGIKKQVLRSYMLTGDTVLLLSLAKGEQDADLRAEAVQQLGVMGAKDELTTLYATETSIPVKKKIIQAMFIGGNAEKLAELARNERVMELRVAAIKNLGLLGGGNSGPILIGFYEDQNPEIRKAVINGLFLQGNSKALISLARKEKDPKLKKELVSKLAIMGGPDTEAFLMEIINQ